MGRRPKKYQPTTALGAALMLARGEEHQGSFAARIKTSRRAISDLERGLHLPSPSTALAVAVALGWTMEQVYEAAKMPLGQEEEQ